MKHLPLKSPKFLSHIANRIAWLLVFVPLEPGSTALMEGYDEVNGVSASNVYVDCLT